MKNDKKSHIFKHLYSTTTCFDSYISLSFIIIDKANSKFDLKTKESWHINWTKPNLNAQQYRLALTLSLQLESPLCSFLSLSFSFLFCLLFSLSLILIISIFYCLLLPLRYSLYLTLIIGIFYCLNYTSLLLHLIITQLVNKFYYNYVVNICPR